MTTARNAARKGVKEDSWVLSPWSGKWRRVLVAVEPHPNSRRIIIKPSEGAEFEVPWNTRIERRSH